jgi:predicted  nucleic acid-binding Zn-ribbon protein
MASLRENLDSLLALQQIDSERDKTRRAIAGLDTGKLAQAAAQAAQTRLKEQQAAAGRTSGALKDAELALATLEKKLKSYEDRMRSGQITNPKEIVNTEREVNQLVRQRATLDEQILNLMDESEGLKTSVVEADAAAGKADQLRQTQLELSRDKRDQLEVTLGDLNRRRAEAASEMADPALMKRYEAIRTRPASAGLAIVRVEDFHCGGCHTQISTQDSHRAKEGEQLILCENCGRILA